MELYSDSNSDSSGESVDQSETAVFTKMDCAPVLHGPSKLHRDYSQPTSVERKLNREECYRGLARCKVLEGSILADRAYKFQKVGCSQNFLDNLLFRATNFRFILR